MNFLVYVASVIRTKDASAAEAGSRSAPPITPYFHIEHHETLCIVYIPFTGILQCWRI
jgi:hypothetical protein